MLFSGGRRCMYTQNWFTLLLQHAVSWSGYCQCGVSKLYTKLRALFCRLICLSRTHCQNNTQQTWWSINFLPSWGIQSLPCPNFKFRSNPRQKFWSRWCLSFLPQSHILFLGLFYVFFFFLIIFTFLGLCRVFTAAYRLSQVAESGCYPLVVMHGFLIVVASVVEHRL